MSFNEFFSKNQVILMEGALGERLKREYGLKIDGTVAMAGLIYTEKGRRALTELWGGYISTAKKYQLPFIATTPTRRANRQRIGESGFDSNIMADNVNFLRELKEKSGADMCIGGLMGCKGDAYTGEGAMSAE